MKDESDSDKVLQRSSASEGKESTQSAGIVDESRRSLTKAGFAAPALITLASQPVFGAQCLSQMMSGNMSHVGDGGCALGWSPGGWKNPVGQINGMDTISAWTMAGFDYGTYSTGKPNKCGHKVSNGPPKIRVSNYPGGTAFNVTALGVAMDAGDGRSMQEILCRVDDHLYSQNKKKRHCITAFLNASLSAVSPSFNYILTVPQVIGLCDGSIPVPLPYGSLNDFLDATWQQ